MGSFLRASITDDNFIRGAARVVYAPIGTAFPTKISDIIVLTAGGTQYDLQAGWVELGATKTGVQISRNNAEETFEVDQIAGDIASVPTNWEMSVQTAFAEMTLETLLNVWQGGAITTDTVPTPDERHLPLGQPEYYVKRRLAVLHKRSNDKIRAHVFRTAQKSPQESTLAYQKQGEQQTAAMRFKCLADSTVSDVDARFGEIIDQV